MKPSHVGGFKEKLEPLYLWELYPRDITGIKIYIHVYTCVYMSIFFYCCVTNCHAFSSFKYTHLLSRSLYVRSLVGFRSL